MAHPGRQRAPRGAEAQGTGRAYRRGPRAGGPGRLFHRLAAVALLHEGPESEHLLDGARDGRANGRRGGVFGPDSAPGAQRESGWCYPSEAARRAPLPRGVGAPRPLGAGPAGVAGPGRPPSDGGQAEPE
eukprot:1023750-Pyramimonas_sp.AAC.1